MNDSSFIEALKNEWKNEKLIIILVLSFLFSITVLLSINIPIYYFFPFLIIVFYIARSEKLKMSIGTFLVIVTIFLNVSFLQQQNMLLKKQLEQFDREERNEKNKKTAKWEELRSSLRILLDIYSYMALQDKILTLSREQQLAIYYKIKDILDSQIDNPVLIENKECFDYWRSAIQGTETALTMLRITDRNASSIIINNTDEIISHNLVQVWVKLIMRSPKFQIQSVN